jgi:type II secretory ATPase GspE/PulE/Tfp pilus assembly ATPase PilB-like protein
MEQKSVVALVTDIITHAERVRASDIHIDPQEKDTSVRFRIDGLLQHTYSIPKQLHQELVARIKIVSGLRTDERLLPQDGRYSASDTLDIRVTTVASYYGESIVMRLLARSYQKQSLTSLGFTEREQKQLSEIVTYPNGLVLVTGPTGSGKTTTLYTLLTMLNRSTESIVTLEDPIEYAIAGIRQLQVHAKRGLHFSTGLRSVLRQDPDIIMVGEIRDTETALLAIQAALTGHLVISTLHTNSATATIMRLMDMGIEPYLIASTLRLVVNQRLLRVVCKACAQTKKVTEKELAFLDRWGQSTSDISMKIPLGCDVCSQTGYKGRSVVAEVLPVTEILKELITKNPNSTQLQSAAISAGMVPIIRSSINKWKDHVTSFEEVARIIEE